MARRLRDYCGKRLEQFNAAKQIAEFDGKALQIPLQ
jgi:hypothetical protein